MLHREYALPAEARRARVEVAQFGAETELLNRNAAMSLLTVRRSTTSCLLNLALWYKEFFC